MGLDFDALRKKLNTLQGQNTRKSATWKPKDGKQVIRIVPWKERPDNPFIELYFHYMGRRTYLSPLTNGNPDPIAEFADSLRRTGEKDDWIQAKKFSPKLRTFAPVIVRGEEDQGVRFWGFGKRAFEQLLMIINDEDWGDITDPHSGRDIGIEYIPQEKASGQFAETKILVKPKQTPLTDDPDQLEEWLTEQPDISEVFEEPSYDELATFLERYLNPDADQSTTSNVLSPSANNNNEDDEDDDDDDDVAEDYAALEAAVDDDEEDEDDSSVNVRDEFAKLFDQ